MQAACKGQLRQMRSWAAQARHPELRPGNISSLPSVGICLDIDWVAQVPTIDLGFRHHPKEYYLTTFGYLLEDPEVPAAAAHPQKMLQPQTLNPETPKPLKPKPCKM